MQRLDPSPWNLASVAARAVPLAVPLAFVAACGPIVGVPQDTDGTEGDPTQPTDPSSPTDPSGPTDPSSPTDASSPGQCDYDTQCPYGYVCRYNFCEPDYGCADYCCGDGTGGCCYGDDSCGYDYCSYDFVCDGGEACFYGGCGPAATPVDCDVPTFTQMIQIEIGAPLLSLAFVDVDGDAPRELAVGFQDGAVVIPGANAAAPIELPIPNGAQVDDIAAADLDLDGVIDLMLSVSGGTSGFVALHGDGTGGFGTGIAPAGVSRSFEMADMDGDALPELVGLFDFGNGWDQLGVLRALGEGGWEAPYLHDPSSLLVLDFEMAPLLGGPGNELITFDSSSIFVFDHGPLDGTPDREVWGAGYFEGTIAIGDFDGGGMLDVVRAQAYGGGTILRIFYGSGGDLVPGDPLWVWGQFPRVDAGDVDGDGTSDIVLSGGAGGVQVVHLTSPLGQACQTFLPTNSDSAISAIGDFTGDGIVDVARAEGTSVLVLAL